MTKKHVNLVIATPGSSLGNYYIKSLFDTFAVLHSKGIEWAWVNDYSSNVADAREITIAGTRVNNPAQTEPFKGDITYDKILWIDSDISWKPEDVIKLYESDKDIISGAYLLPTGEATIYPELLKPGILYEDFLKKEDLFEIDAAGFGFVCIKKGIFEKMTRPWFQATEVNYSQDGQEFKFNILGEDLAWFIRAKQLGFQAWCDPSVKVTHHKTMRLTWEGPQA